MQTGSEEIWPLRSGGPAFINGMILPMPKLLTFVFLSLSVSSLAQDRLLTIDDLYDPDKKINFNGTFPSSLRWFNDGQHYLELDSGSLQKVNALTGAAKALFDADRLQSAFKAVGLEPEEAGRAARLGRKTLCPAERGLLIHHADDLFFYQMEQNSLVRMTNSAEKEREAAFSPSGELVAFVRGNDLHVISVKDGHGRRLTRDGSREVLNGILDWVYQEEIFGRENFRGFWWSPDSTQLAFLRLDESEVPEFMVVNYEPVHLDLQPMKYPKAGDPNPTVRLGIVSIADGRTRWADLRKYQSEDFLIVSVSWKPDASTVVVQVQNRQQNWLDLNLVDVATGQTATVLRETSEAWVSVLDDPYWLQDGSFLWQSERTGFRHLYHYSSDGDLLGAITSGDWEVRDLEAVDESKGLVYFSGTRDTHLETHLYRVGLDGKGLVRITKEDGDHKVSFSPACTHYIDTWSDVSTPPQVGLFDDQGSFVRAIAENPVKVLEEYALGNTQFVQVQGRDGFELNALMIRPPDFDPRNKYPVLCHTYNGPYSHQITSQRVRNKWGGTGYLWHQLLAQEGYVIWICDSRTASGKGVSSAWPAYRNLGRVELRDLEDMLAWLKSKPFVDQSRIGLWGWSYGGFMTVYALTHSESFKLGIAGAPVTDWSLYDSVYTERYMDLPAENQQGYRDSSAMNSATALNGKLLLIHGAMDDNVHVQNTYKLADRLQRAGKEFELMIYPRSRHSITEPRRLKHMKLMMTRFILENL